MLKYIIWNFLINKHCFHPCQGSLFQRKLLTGSSFNIPFTSAAHKVPVKFYLGVVALELNEPKRNSSLSQTGTRCWFICEKRSSCQRVTARIHTRPVTFVIRTGCVSIGSWAVLQHTGRKQGIDFSVPFV